MNRTLDGPNGVVNKVVKERSGYKGNIQDVDSSFALDIIDELAGSRSIGRADSSNNLEIKNRWQSFHLNTNNEKPSDEKLECTSPRRSRVSKQPSRFSRVKNRNFTKQSSGRKQGGSVSSSEKTSSADSNVHEIDQMARHSISISSLPEKPAQLISSGRDPPGLNRSVLKCYSSSSSLEETQEDEARSARRQRVSRRKGKKRAHKRKAKSEKQIEHEFGDSFQLSFSSHSSNDQEKKVMGTFAPFENSFEVFEASTNMQWAEAAIALESDAAATSMRPDDISQTDTMCTAADIKFQMYTLAQQHRWDEVAAFCRKNPWAAKHVDEDDGTTVLHLAVMSRANPYLRGTSLRRAPLDLIKSLVAACPEAAIVRCSLKKYTPLCYVCLVSERDFDMEDAAKMAKILLSGASQCAMVFTDEGYSALDIHIISYSKLHDEKAETLSSKGRSSTTLLRTLLKKCPALVDSRPYGQRTKGPVEILYRCNLKEFKAASGKEIVCPKRSAFCDSVTSTICDWWAWKWTITLLEASSKYRSTGRPHKSDFSVVHAAAQIVGCPVSVLHLSIDAFPDQVKQRSQCDEKLNCPLHEVCSWVTDDAVVCGDSFVQKRKSKAIAVLLQAFPNASRMTNALGETPLQLAVETCTQWDGGLGALALTFPKALLIQRNLDYLPEDSPLAHAICYHDDDLGSVGGNESDSVDGAVSALKGSFPFIVAAALSYVPERRLRSMTPHNQLSAKKANDQIQHQVKTKALDSLSAIYGLLRTKPQALHLYMEYQAMMREASSDESLSGDASNSSEESTEALSLSDLAGHNQ